ncbi:MAG: hypothetical protein ACD_3C00083G0010 [uncultured bacterium (gcode 4)]|uniref:Methyltransferase type 11 n=1 Tax=uncultured bacterium (gcode 4) TaxID=1234023 RepID=K2FAW3_9BACT|nr:MAG: hypothetical protein ACD_3C00083G0010 [uncultured bacterium (gcode 4)]
MDYIDYLKNRYDEKTFSRKQDYIRHNFSKFISKKNNLKVLEIWPWMWEFVDYMNKCWVEDITLVDNDESILNHNIGLYKIKKTILLNDSITELKEELENYDLIFLTQVFEHVPVNQQNGLLAFLFSLLNEGWHVIITVPNANNFLSLVERYSDFTHTCLFTSNSLIQLSENIGVTPKNIILQGYRIPPYELINFVRIILQKILHLLILCIYIINWWVYWKILTPNISLIIRKD